MKRIIVLVLLLGFFTSGFTQITRGEFFWDNDPGVGNATALTAENGSFDNQLEIMVHQSIPSLTEGIHVLHVRIKDNSNNWSPVFKTLVRVDKALEDVKSHITTAEYFIDTDPGEGNGIAMVAFDGDYNDALETALLPMINTVPAGMHVLGVRVKDANNNWSPAFKTTFKADGYFTNWKAPGIQAAEYFIDTDPGEGNGIAMVAFDGNFSDALDTASANFNSGINPGLHRIGFRVMNAQQAWGNTFLTTFYAEDCPEVLVPALADTSICAGQSIELNAPEGFQSYLWDTGVTGRSINVTQQGTYTVTVTDANGCKGSTSIEVKPNGPVKIDWLAAKGFSTTDYPLVQHADKNFSYMAFSWDNSNDQHLKIDESNISSTSPLREIVLVKLKGEHQTVSTHTISIPGISIYLNAMTSDTDGNLYFSGWYANEFTFNEISHPKNEYFIIKTDSLANILWVSTGGNPTTGGDNVYDMKCSDGKLYLAGRIEKSGEFFVSDKSAYSYGRGSFVACLNAENASCNWVKVVENDLNTKKVAVDYEGNVYLSGTFEGSNLQVDGVSLPDSLFQNNYNRNTYISKYSASGDFQWIRVIKNTSGYYDFKFNKANELLLLCHATKNFYINNIPFSFPEDKYLGSSFLAKLDKNGNLLKCILQNSPYRGLESISADRFCIMGRMDDFKTVEIFGTDTLAPANYLTERKFFVAVFNENLEALSGKAFLGSFGSNSLNIKSKNDGTLSVSGSVIFANEARFEQFGDFIINREGTTNYAVAILDPQKLQAWETIELPKDTAFCEGREITLSAPAHLSSYRWSTGSTERSITLNQSTDVVLSGTESHGCPLQSNTFRLTVNPLPQPRLGNDTILAPDRFLVLFPGMFNSYLWHDGKTGMMNTIGLDVNTGTHTAWVKVTNEFGCENTDSITITFATVDVKNVEKNTIYVYPVPAREYITINTSLEIDRIEVYDVSGKLMLHEDTNGEQKTVIDIRRLLSGNYLVRVIKNNKQLQTFKFTKE